MLAVALSVALAVALAVALSVTLAVVLAVALVIALVVVLAVALAVELAVALAVAIAVVLVILLAVASVVLGATHRLGWVGPCAMSRVCVEFVFAAGFLEDLRDTISSGGDSGSAEEQPRSFLRMATYAAA